MKFNTLLKSDLPSNNEAGELLSISDIRMMVSKTVNDELLGGIVSADKLIPNKEDDTIAGYTKVHCTTTSVYCRPSANLPGC